MIRLAKRLGLRGKREGLLGGSKVFCIGLNKTGTTSLQKAFQDLGFHVGDQRVAELLYDRHYFKREFAPIIQYCRTAQVFQDLPFSCPYLFVALDQAFPGSRFILTVRRDADQWYSSITRFHGKLWGSDGRAPTAEQLRAAPYVRTGWAYSLIKLHGTPESDPYNKPALIAHYERHNADVQRYFADRPDDLLVIDVGAADSYQRFIEFLGIPSPFSAFPWENKT